MRRRLLIGVAALTAVLGGAAIVRWAWPNSAAGSGSGSTTAQGANCPRWVQHAQLRYTLDMQSEITAATQTVLKFQLSGFWQTTALSVSDKETFVRVEVVEPNFRSELRADATEMETLRRGFAQPLYLTLDSRGRPLETRKTSETPPLVEQLVSYVAAASQFSCPEKAALEWHSEELDPTGRYRARYRTNPSGETEKTKLSYIEVFGMAPSGPVPRTDVEILSSLAVFRFERSAMTKLSFSEATNMEGQGPAPKLASSTKIKLSLEDRSVAAVDPAELARARALPLARVAQRPVSASPASLDTDAVRTAGLTFSEALGKWKSTGQEQKAERARLFVALSAILRTEPKAVADAVARILRRDGDSGVLIDSLGHAGSADAQAALRQIVGSRGLDGSVRKQALIALSLTRGPTADTVGWLTSLTDDPALGRQARYGLGNAAYQTAQSDPERSETAVAALTALLEQQRESSQVIDTLTALGAAGSRAALPQIELFTRHDNAAVRGAAFYALRRIPGEDVDRLLAQALMADSQQSVRERGVEAAKQRSFSTTLARGVQVAATSDQSVSIRYHAIEVLIRWVRTAPDLKPTLAWIAVNDTSERVRTLAAGAMTALAEPG